MHGTLAALENAPMRNTLRTLLMSTAVAAAALVALSVRAPAMAADDEMAPGTEEQSPAPVSALPGAQPPKRLFLDVQTGYPRYDAYVQERRAREEMGRGWARSSVHEDMRDGATPPWERSQWGD